jgi:hypothetical protein
MNKLDSSRLWKETRKKVARMQAAKMYIPTDGISEDLYVEKMIPGMRDIVKASLNAHSQGEGARISKFAAGLTQLANGNTSPIAKDVAKSLNRAIIQKGVGIEGKGTRQKALISELLDNAGRPLTEQDLLDVIMENHITSCPFCEQEYGSSVELANHVGIIHLSYDSEDEIEKADFDRSSTSRYETSFDASGNTARILLLNANAKVSDYLNQERMIRADHSGKVDLEPSSRKRVHQTNRDQSGGWTQAVGLSVNEDAEGLSMPSQQILRLRPIGETEIV